MNILFVCLGNICRSPSAEAVMAAMVSAVGRDDDIVVDSAGTAPWHVGDRPDADATAALRRSGYRTEHRGRQLQPEDFERFDLIAVMDRANLRDAWNVARTDADRAKLALLRSFDPTAPDGAEVDDPYGRSAKVFDETLSIIERACAGLLAKIA
jgi:protein-tyrosine phosphatase